MKSGSNPYHKKHPSKSYNDQKNHAEFAEEYQTLRPEKAKAYPPNLNQIPKKITE
ncbi:hypothetical protein [Paenibacillus sp.]|uniref:hypothetical protein n=1 Tax=Paenibacillus sp. TaxID=58172 RepID=UPI002D2881DA|nr:hypothetical protein [Paenibacillus sp.]HZG56326.1 hypothetical protein [Paenibacillus sp.]